MKRIIITRSQLNEVFEIKQLKKVQNKIYKTVSDYCGKMHSDSAWQDVKVLIEMIKSVDFVDDVIVGAGEYTNYTNPENGAYRDYNTTVVTPFGNLYGYIRCHAAGTMDDIFKYYDMTISLYPDKKRDIEQVTEVTDNQKTKVVFDGNNANELGINAQEKYNDAIRSGLKPNAIQMNGKTVNNNVSDNDETVIGFDSNEPNIRDAVSNSVQNAVDNGADINKLNVQGNSEDITNSVSESKKYTKQQIERARLYEMRRNGKIMTKKELRETFGEEENIVSLINNSNSFQAMEAYRLTYGNEALKELSNGWNFVQGMVNKYYDSTPDKQQEFVARLKGERNDDPNAIDAELELNEDISDEELFDEYSIGVDGYDIRTGKIKDFNGMGDNDDVFDNIEEAYNTIKYMLTYPEQSAEYDIRYANNCILLLSILKNYTPIDNILYMSSLDKQYYREILKKIPNTKIKLI